MITVAIGQVEVPLENAEPNWINEQINRRRNDGSAVCIKVRINQNDLHMRLSSANCNSTGGGGRPPTPKEQRIFDLWDQRGLNRADFTGGNLVAFLRQLSRFL